jgi:two-component system CheB/CheR fusion protein
MLFLESFDQLKRWPSLKIFATDVEQQNIEIGGAGSYP